MNMGLWSRNESQGHQPLVITISCNYKNPHKMICQKIIINLHQIVHYKQTFLCFWQINLWLCNQIRRFSGSCSIFHLDEFTNPGQNSNKEPLSLIIPMVVSKTLLNFTKWNLVGYLSQLLFSFIFKKKTLGEKSHLLCYKIGCLELMYRVLY